MSKTNCINCGAEKEAFDLQCPFCGTKYADLTTLELFSGKPLFVQLKGHDGHVTTAKAYITNTTLTMHPAVTCLYGMEGMIHRHVNAMNVSGTIDFALFESLYAE